MNNTSIIPIFIPHIGCPHNCVFCDQKHIAGKVNAPTPDEVSKQIEEALERNHKTAPQVAFYGGSFTAIAQEEQTAYLSAVRPWIKKGDVSSIRISTRPDFINPEILSHIREYGVRTIELGIQSFDDRVLKASCRGHSAQVSINAVKCVKECGFELIIQLMAGLPLDTREIAFESACKAAELSPDGVRIYPVAVIEGTALAEMYKCGKYSALTLEEAVEWSADMLEVFISANIPPIRIGLNPSDGLENVILAGAYHPALGEMVRSRFYLRKARKALEMQGCIKGKNAVITVGKKCVSLMCGQHSCNRKALKDDFKLSSLSVIEGNLSEWDIDVLIK